MANEKPPTSTPTGKVGAVHANSVSGSAHRPDIAQGALKSAGKSSGGK